MKFTRILSLALAIAVAAIATPAAAQFSRQDLSKASTISPTLKQIKETKTIVIGVRETVAPFSFNNGSDQFIGYSVELCEDVIRSLRLDLGLDSLRVIYMPVTGKDRVEIIAANNADMECGSTTNTAARQKTVSFSNAQFYSQSYFVGKKGQQMRGLEDLRGKRVALPEKTIQLKAVEEANADKKLGITIRTYRDPNEAFMAVLGGDADFTSTDDLFLIDMMLNVPGAKDKLQFYNTFAFLPNTYGIMLPKNDPAFVDVVNNYLNAMYQGGKAEKLYVKWLMSPIPPKQNNLAWPMPAQLKELFKKPSSEPLL